MKKTVRQQQKEQTKALLLKTAYEVFSERGIMNTRISDIAEAAGVSHGTLFVHFKTQEALIEEVIETYTQKIAVHTRELAESCGSLEDLLRAHLSGIMEYEPFYARLVIEGRLLPAGARVVWVAMQSVISFHFAQAAERELKLPEKNGTPIYFLFNLWMGLIHYYLLNGDLFTPEGGVIRRYRDMLVDNFMRLLPKPEEDNR